MFIANGPLGVKSSSVGAAWLDLRWTCRPISAVEIHAAPSELGQVFGVVASMNMSLLAEL